jgi:E3 ubiquitin-protein ligase UBR3
MVVDVEHRLIVKNVYWPLLSDFVNILSQEKIALAIIENKKYFNLWLRFLTLFQGSFHPKTSFLILFSFFSKE